MTDDTDDEEYNSGPFCRHFGDPWDCSRLCAACGHNCHQHGSGHDNEEPCDQPGCFCEGWEEKT